MCSKTHLCPEYLHVANDHTQNELEESMAMFESLTKMKRFKKIPIILLLNKADMLEEKMKEKPISDYLPTCPRDADCVTACNFFSDIFARLDKRPHGALHTHVTSAVNRAVFERTMKNIQPILTRNAKRQSREAREELSPGSHSSSSQRVHFQFAFHMNPAATPPTGHKHTKSCSASSPRTHVLHPYHVP